MSQFVRMVPIPEQVDALGAVLGNLDGVLMTDAERADALVWAWEGMRASAIEARRAATVQQGVVHESAVGVAETPESLGSTNPNTERQSL